MSSINFEVSWITTEEAGLRNMSDETAAAEVQ